MTTNARRGATHSNAGLLAIERMIEQRATEPSRPAADDQAKVAPDVLMATDGIAIEFVRGISDGERAVVEQGIKTFLGRNWRLRDEDIPGPTGPNSVFRGLTALPPPDEAPSAGDAWLLADRIAALEGVQSAIPLFALVAPQQEQAAEVPLGLEAAGEPTDPVLRREWHLRVLKIPEAWAYTRAQRGEPGQGIVVAVLDTGYTDHPEIFERLKIVPKADLLDGNDPRDPLEGRPPLTFPGHGTSVASVIASPETLPGGVDQLTGIVPAARVLPIRMTTSVVLILPNKIVPAVRWAVDHGADVINVSLGLPYYWPALHAAIRYAVEHGVIVVGASGNYWPAVVYPAAFREVVGAAGCDWQRQPWAYASAGEAVDVLAPGVAVQNAHSRLDEHGAVEHLVAPGTGTTYAAACCSGLAALWLAHHGGRQQLIAHYGDAQYVARAFHFLLRTTAVAPPGLPGNKYGEGIPHALRLLEAGLPSRNTLNRDMRGLQLHMAPVAEVRGSALPGLVVEDILVRPERMDGLRQLLGLAELEALPAEVVSEVCFHLVAHPQRRAVFLDGDVRLLRTQLLASGHLSSGLRRRLEAAASALAPVGGHIGAGATLTFQPRSAPDPTQRALQVYAFDPSLAGSLRTADYNAATVNIPWEPLEAGPVGEYLEVVDVDPASGCCYQPVHLDDVRLLASHGVTPDEGDPWFHQQMVYAVAMKTIRHFETALGRPAMWAVGRRREGKEREPFYQRLRIYPHALRERNAYYSPEKRALLFGYFRSAGPQGTPTGPMVFTCLSYDIIAHETTHALLDGMYHRYTEDTNPDVLAFHEAFADIVALFQHFTHPEVVRSAIAETRGNLELDSPLGKLAQQFGEATGRRGALRDAIGYVKDGIWQRRQPDPSLLERPDHRASPHLRGSILVAAVFDAFLKIYQRRTRPVIRLATGGSEVVMGSLSTDLVEALAHEAAKTAGHMLQICIRALDYLPPVDISFGDYLRAVVTADRDLVPDDPLGYRVAFVEAFRAWGIQSQGVTTVAPESLRWSQPEGYAMRFALSAPLLDQLNRLLPAWLANRSRKELHEGTVEAKKRFNRELRQASQALGDEIGIELNRAFEVHTLRPAATLGPDGRINPTVVVTLLQKKLGPRGLIIRTGSTIIFSRGDGRIRYVIHKRDGRGQRADELKAHQQFRLSHAAELEPYLVTVHQGEPFASLHLLGHL
jgi:hypothetical protein